MRIGLLLAEIQHVERVINAYLALRFPAQSVTLEQIALFESSKRTKMFGELFKTLRKRAPTLDSNLDTLFTTFLRDRNRFVHGLFTERGYNITNANDVSKIREFVDSLRIDSTVLLIAFNAIIEIWFEKGGLDAQQDAFQSASDILQMSLELNLNSPSIAIGCVDRERRLQISRRET
jgi:hypothetical protein